MLFSYYRGGGGGEASYRYQYVKAVLCKCDGAIEKSFYVGEPLPIFFFQSVELVILRALRGRAVVG